MFLTHLMVVIDRQKLGCLLGQWLLGQRPDQPSVDSLCNLKQIKVLKISLSQILSYLFFRIELPFNCKPLVNLSRILQLIRNIVIVPVFRRVVHLLDSNINDLFQPVFRISKLINKPVEMVVLFPEYVLSQSIMLQELLPDFQFVIIPLLFHYRNAFSLLSDSLHMRIMDQRVSQVLNISMLVFTIFISLVVVHWSLKNWILILLWLYRLFRKWDT